MDNAIETSITIPLYHSENRIDREQMVREFNEQIDLIEKQLKESQWIQHTTEKHYLNGIVKNFTGTKDRDKIKNDYCSKSGIKLVRLQWIKKTEDLEKQLNKLFYETD